MYEAESFRDSFLTYIRREAPELDEQEAWREFANSHEYYKCYFGEEVVTEVRRYSLLKFISEELHLKMDNIKDECSHICSCIFTSDERVDILQRKFVFTSYLWKKFDFNKNNYDFNIFILKFLLKDQHFDIKSKDRKSVV